jgi:hypothetical protein
MGPLADSTARRRISRPMRGRASPISRRRSCDHTFRLMRRVTVSTARLFQCDAPLRDLWASLWSTSCAR